MLYVNQKVEVTGDPTRPADRIIQVVFGHNKVTLCLSLVEASWLAANLGREIRKIESDHPELASFDPMGLKRGDMVRVRDDHGIEADYKVKHEPWELGNGTWVIGLAGISGGYALSRVIGVISRATSS